MASDEEDDELEALRQAALATLKKRTVSAELEDAQPIPQITGSGHSLTGAGAQWVEDFPANLSQSPFGSNQPASAFQDGVWNQPFHPNKFHQTSPKRFGQNNWRVGRGLYPKQTARGRGVSLRRGQPFHPKGAAFPHPTRVPYVQSAPAPNRGSNLIVINTVPEDEGGAVQECAEVVPVAPQRAGLRTGTSVAAGKNSSTILPLENSSKPFLIRPQDKYCSTSDRPIRVQESTTSRKKKKDKFSRFDSSGSDSDDESESDDENARGEDVSSQSCSPSTADIILDESKDISSILEESGTNVLDTVDSSLSIAVASETQSDNMPEMDVSPSVERKCDSDTDEHGEEKLLLSPITESVTSPELHQSAAAVPADIDSDDDNNKSPLPFVSVLEPSDECASSASKLEEVKSDHDNNSSSAEESSSLSDEEADSESESAATGSESVASGSESISELSDEGDSDGDDQDSSVSEEQTSESSSSSESEKEIERQKTVKRPPDISVKVAASQSNTHATRKKEPESNLSPVERAKLEARKRKFASREEVHVSTNKTISLKGIVAKPKKVRVVGEVAHTKSLTVVKAAQPETRKANQELSQKSFADAHRKHSRRKILLDPKLDGSSPQDDARDVSDTDEDEEEEEDKRDRSWKREASSKTGWHKSSRSLNHTLPNDNFARSQGHSFRDNARREFGRNGSQQRAYNSRNKQAGVRTYHHGSPTGGDYCSSDEEKDENGRKLISVVVSRSTTNQQLQNSGQNLVTSQERTFKGPRRPIVPRKREASSSASVVNPGNNGDGRLVLHSKLFQGSDSLTYKESGTTGIVSSEDAPLEKRSRVKADRKPVHQRLGWKDVEGRSSRSTVHSHKRNETNSDSALQAVPSQHCHHPHGVF
ncbi:transcriptional regulator ATRX-like isoform X2 [Pomacea canaliculata]|uniref:transcriptional regulator ATRX-like isoform X2 n=1 Tax=Pomacea canaliculata TaxID=400727 RepID=UPI000D73D1D5|nr:transcriptional regulator ATRX-like isoform X2 [Pomacea canaliculata]